MPYSKAHFFLIGLLVITFIAFWNSYFGKLLDASLAHHLHGITSTIWILLIAAQSWFIHQSHVSMHRKMGRLIFILAPLMVGAFALVILAGANKAVGQHPFYVQFGQALLATDLLLLLMTSLQIYLALKFRRKVRLHSALILGTLIGLLPPILSRLLGIVVPGLAIDGLDTLYRFEYSLQLGFMISLLFAMILFFSHRKEGWPWLLAAGITTGSYLIYATLGQSSVWQQVVLSLSKINPIIAYISGFMIGTAACIFGWRHGKRTQ